MNRRMTRIGGVVACGVAMLASTGCTTMLKRGFKEIRGAQTAVVPVSSYSPRFGENYNSIRFSPATTTLTPRVCPTVLLTAFDRWANELWAEEGVSGGGSALDVSTEVLFFEEKGLFSAGQLIARVRARADGATVADLLLHTENESFRDGDESDMARSAAKALVKLLVGEREKPKATESQ
ncbi:MAG: hypothetical protein KDA32_08515 [Phycisphaerales bacterium]|nr:hypothetical protein [Phycisphaerales bacterium]